MNISWKRLISAQVMLLAGGLPVGAGAWAQASDDAQAGNRIEDIVVTAQRREENLQDVPIAITALSAQDLKDRSVNQIADLQSATPNVTFRGSGQGTAATTIGIRGIRSSNIELVNDQPAAIYIDGVYQSTAIGSSALLGPDVQRIEVLRGPQGTLFGRNSIAGAVSITTQRPEHDLSARAMMGLGNHGFMEASAMVNIPLGSIAAARFNVAYRDDDGFANDRTYGRRLGRTQNTYLRGQLLVEPSDSFDILFQGDYLRTYTEGPLNQPIYLTPPTFRDQLTNATHSLAFTAIATQLGLAPTPANYQTVLNYFLACGGGRKPNLADRCFSPPPPASIAPTGIFAPSGEQDPAAFYRDYGGTVTARLGLTDTVDLKSITSYRDFIHDSPRDYDGTPVTILFSRARPSGKTFTQELQLSGTLFDRRLTFATGAFYYHFDGVELANNNVLAPLSGVRSYNYLRNDLVNKSIGVYAQGTFRLADSLRVTAGIRYTSEDKSVNVTQFQSQPAPTNQVCTLPIPNAQCLNSADLTYSAWDYTVGVDYDIADDVMIYARVAKGFQAGGINQRSTTGVPFQSYLPQSAINYELGFKADLFDRRVRLNVAAFQTDISDLQRNVPQSFLVNGVPVSVVATLNAADARIRGFEGELTVVPFDNARISAQFGHADPEYKRFFANGPGGPGTLDLSNTAFQNSSKWTWGVSPAYTLPTTFGEVHFQLDYFWQSKAELQPLLSYPLETEFPEARIVQPGYGILNGQIALRIGDDLEFTLWAKNLTDKRYFVDGTNLANSIGFGVGTVGSPRTFGLRASKTF